MKNKSILIVDDEVSILNSLRKDLMMEDYQVTTALNGAEAMKILKSGHFDLVVTDLIMPGFDGIRVLQEAKTIDPEICVIILTGYGDLTSAIAALRLGADDYLLKPCDNDELLLRITRSLEKQEAFYKIKFYENILPVCAYCKNIRDDTATEPGKGKWMRMEEYIHQKSGTRISHGCCPECFEKHKAYWK
jgi:DNA-binding NtrC family response regulator